MSRIELPKPVRDALADALSRHLKDELDLEVKGFDAVFLLDWIAEHVGPHFYNQGLADAQAVVRKRADDIAEAVSHLEKPARV